MPDGTNYNGLPVDRELTDAERWPLRNEAGVAMYKRLTEHQDAPAFSHRCGDRVDASVVSDFGTFSELVDTGPSGGPADAPWLQEFLDDCARRVPKYLDPLAVGRPLEQWPTISRNDLARSPWSFVPDGTPLDDLIVYDTSGTTTGQTMDVCSSPTTVARHIAMLRAALATRGVEWAGGAGEVAVVQVCWQASTFTIASTSTILGQAGQIKINLNPALWPDNTACARYITDLCPQIITGDPIAFAHLLALDIPVTPRAFLSTSQQVPGGLCAALEARYGCPVVDVYSMTETGVVSAAGPAGHRTLQPRLVVEILDENGNPCPDGVVGEITVTGGYNPMTPLVRYRTGDRAAKKVVDGVVHLVGFGGRPPVWLRHGAGHAINTIDVTRALRAAASGPIELHQNSNGTVVVRGLDNWKSDLLDAAREVFAEPATWEVLDDVGLATCQITSDLTFEELI